MATLDQELWTLEDLTADVIRSWEFNGGASNGFLKTAEAKAEHEALIEKRDAQHMIILALVTERESAAYNRAARGLPR